MSVCGPCVESGEYPVLKLRACIEFDLWGMALADQHAISLRLIICRHQSFYQRTPRTRYHLYCLAQGTCFLAAWLQEEDPERPT